MDILTTAAQAYMITFNGYITQFLQWGQWLFFALLTLNIVWMSIWYAFDRSSISESMPAFIKKFFVAALFYTIMVNPSWLTELLTTAQFMGSTLTGKPMDPSSLISEGIGLGNQVLAPLSNTSLLLQGFSILLAVTTYVVVEFVFISIALELALTLILATALISVASFFLGFAGLGATTSIARQTLDVLLANCIKLLGIYLVIAAGSQTVTTMAASIPTTVGSFDPYVWLVAVAWLFWLTAKHLPMQLARIFSGAVQETHHSSSMGALVSAANATWATGQNLAKLGQMAGNVFSAAASSLGSLWKGITGSGGGGSTPSTPSMPNAVANAAAGSAAAGTSVPNTPSGSVGGGNTANHSTSVPQGSPSSSTSAPVGGASTGGSTATPGQATSTAAAPSGTSSVNTPSSSSSSSSPTPEGSSSPASPLDSTGSGASTPSPAAGSPDLSNGGMDSSMASTAELPVSKPITPPSQEASMPQGETQTAAPPAGTALNSRPNSVPTQSELPLAPPEINPHV